MPTESPRHARGPAAPGGGLLTAAALALLGFGVAVFADHIASYYLLQWAPTLRRYPTPEERDAVLRALALDRATHAAMWLALFASLYAWRRGARRRERWLDRSAMTTFFALGIATYAVLRALVESQLAIRLVRVPDVSIGIDWHGPGLAFTGLALLLATLVRARPTAARASLRVR